jgi:hypothetical protein
MLNIKPVFSDALTSILDGGDHLEAAPLAATIYLMQRDVINQYRYALEHYLTAELSAPFLQNSSLGTPFQKWAKFTNDDFKLLSFLIHNLIRYTARLLSETLSGKHKGQREFAKSKEASDKYISVLVKLTPAEVGIGLFINEPYSVKVRSLEVDVDLATSGTRDEVCAWGSDSDRRNVLRRLVTSGENEIAILLGDHEAYAAACQQFYGTRRVIAPFERPHPWYYV